MRTKMLNTPDGQIRIYAEAQELALKAARYFARLADQYVLGGGRFTVALPGGSTPRRMLSLLAGPPFLDTLPWSSTYFFWGDERTVPPDHPDSNYRMAWETLLAKVPVPPENIFRIRGEAEDPEQAAEEYSDTLKVFFSREHPGSPAGTAPLSGWPRFDLVLLGMGSDGHTASLFPGTAALNVTDKIAVANEVPQLTTRRITLTVPTINNARNVTFLTAGEDKSQALKEVLQGPIMPDLYPSQLIRPSNGTLLWLVDQAAAKLLNE